MTELLLILFVFVPAVCFYLLTACVLYTYFKRKRAVQKLNKHIKK